MWCCAEPGCPSRAWGFGSAVGLRALGWYFEPGPEGPRCPVHRPDPVPCRLPEMTEGRDPEPCSGCAADAEAARLQGIIGRELGLL